MPRKPTPLKTLVLATNNRHKVGEIKRILKAAGMNWRLLTLKDFKRFPKVIEDKPTLEGNAVKKARLVASATRFLALADDSGLFVDALRGRPGVYSARFAGSNCSYEDNNRKVLRMLKNVPLRKRQATFRCVAAMATPSGKSVWIDGKIRGRIDNNFKGKKGFGYDPIFYVPKFGKTFAEMSASLKNHVSHRGKAFRKIPRIIKSLL